MNQTKWYKFLLSEITTLPKDIYSKIEEELEKSQFWTEPHTDDDIKGKKSPLTQSLQQALDYAFIQSGLNIISKVLAIKGGIKPDNNDSYLAGGSYFVNFSGKSIVEIILYPFPDENFELDHEIMIEEIAEIIRHELIHAGQTERRAKRKKISLKQAGKEIGDDKRAVPKTSQTDPQYEEIYYSRKNEIEAYAHQTAELLIKIYGKDNALKYISLPYDHQEMPEYIRDLQIWKPLKNRPKALKRLKSRIYTYIQHLTEK